MAQRNLSRREFHTLSFALGASASAAGGSPRTKSVRLGGPVFARKDDPEELARAHRALGYRAAYCPRLSVRDTDRIGAVRNAFKKYDVVIAEVGRWVNLLERDPRKREKNMDFVIEGLALADEVGARCCVDIAGSFNEKVWYGPHPDNLSDRFFDAIVANARRIIDAVKPKRTVFAYEMMGWALPDSADSYLRLIKAVDRKAFGVHLDPCNLINSPRRYWGNSQLINECFDKLGRWIASCHAKDLSWQVEMNVHFKEVIPGKGVLDYATYLKRLASLPQRPPLMLEHLRGPEEYDQGREYIFGVGKRIGVAF